MPTVRLDAMDGADFEQTRDMARYVRTGWVDDIDLVSTSDADALVRVRPLLPAFGTSLGPQSPGLRLQRVRVLPQLEKYRRVRVFLTYETEALELQPTIYIIRDRSWSEQRRSAFLPGTRVPLIATYGTLNRPVFFNFNYAVRSIQVTVLRYGRPNSGAQNYMNHVNNAAWPTGNASFGQFGGITDQPTATQLPIGYWRLNSYSSEFDRQSLMTLVNSEAITRVIEDWSDVGMMVTESGTYPFASLTEPQQNAEMTTVNGPSYTYGGIAQSTLGGVIRIGGYPLASFPSIFGF